MKIVLANRSPYDPEDLKALVRAAIKHTGADIETLRLSVRTQRSNGRVNGRATCREGVRVWLKCSMDLFPKAPDKIDLDRFKKTVIHEAMHLAGATHSTMTEEQRYCTFELPSWAQSLPLRTKEQDHSEVIAERKAAERTERLEHAKKMLAKAQTRLKRAATIEKKWLRRVGALSR